MPTFLFWGFSNIALVIAGIVSQFKCIMSARVKFMIQIKLPIGSLIFYPDIFVSDGFYKNVWILIYNRKEYF